MKKKLIKLLETQVKKLEAEDFDLEAWKSTASSALTRVFGKGNPKTEQIEALKIDYSSWALRDSNSRYQPIESCKRKGKEILNASIEELEVFGLPVKHEDALGEVFTSSEMEKLKTDENTRVKLISKLKKEELQKLVLKLLETD